MNAHDWSLVSYLKMHQGSGIDALADHLGVRERTVFSYIKHANAELAPSAQIIFKRDGSGEGGYYLAVDDQEQFQRLLAHGKMPDDLPQTPQERADYLVNDLLSRSGWITLDALSEMLYVSRATLSGDLRAVERELGRFGLTLERRPHYGLRVAGPEMSRRLCLADAALSQLRQSDSSMGGG